MQIVMTKSEYISNFESGAISLWSRDLCKYNGKYYSINCPTFSENVVLEPVNDPTPKKED